MTAESGEPISEQWLRDAGFKWHDVEHSGKHWILWLGDINREPFNSFDDLGIELAAGIKGDTEWFCWLRADTDRRYSRFIHIRHLKWQHEVVAMIEGLTGVRFNAADCLYGSFLRPEASARARERAERLDQRINKASPWSDAEKDETRDLRGGSR